MAKVTLTITDDEDGFVDMKFEFDPPAKEGERTGAQQVAVDLACFLSDVTEPGVVKVNDKEIEL